MFDWASSASAAAEPGISSTASHNGPDIRSSTAVRVRNARCRAEIRASNSDSTYSLTSRSPPPKETTAPSSVPPSRRHSAARYSTAAHPSVRWCSSATSSSPSATSAARSSKDASSRVSDRSPGPISVILPSARSRATRSGGLARPDSASRDPLGTRSEEHTSELQSRGHLVCRLLLEKKKKKEKSKLVKKTKKNKKDN